MASPTRWAWVWINSGSWWWTGRPGVLRFMGLQRVGHDWVTELMLLPRLGYCKQCCNEHWVSCIHIIFVGLWVYNLYAGRARWSLVPAIVSFNTTFALSKNVCLICYKESPDLDWLIFMERGREKERDDFTFLCPRETEFRRSNVTQNIPTILHDVFKQLGTMDFLQRCLIGRDGNNNSRE